MGLLGEGAAQRDAGGCLCILVSRVTQVDISREEQRVLHMLAQGGMIKPLKDKNGRIATLELYNRDGWRIPMMEMLLFKKLKRKKVKRWRGSSLEAPSRWPIDCSQLASSGSCST